MPLTTPCPNCQKSLRVLEDAIGKTVRCPKCKHLFRVQQVEKVRTDDSLQELASMLEAAFGQTQQKEKQTDPWDPQVQPDKIGRFTIQEVLGDGGFGRVYRAHDPLLDRTTALKVPLRGNKASRLRTLEEAKSAANLRHPAIVGVYEVGLDDPSYIASEYINGRPLSEVIKAGQFELESMVGWLIAVCRALSYAHSQGVVHRDVKPHNILIDEHNNALLTDFGLALRTANTKETQGAPQLVGTLAYMSPEQASGDSEVGPASDQYNLGVVLYQVLAARKPFEGQSHSVLSQIVKGDFEPPSRHEAGCDRALEAICLKSIRLDPAERYPSCDEMADDLQRWLKGELVEATRPSLVRRTAHWAKQRPHWAAWIAAVAAIWIAVSGITFVVGTQRITRASEIERSVGDANSSLTPTDAPQRLAVSGSNAAALPTSPAMAASPVPLDENHAADVDKAADVNKAAAYTLSDYAETLEQASIALAYNQSLKAHRLLDRVPRNFRGVEHSLLRRQAMGTPHVLKHKTSLKTLTWSPDSKLLVASDQYGSVFFYDAVTLEPLGRASLPLLSDLTFIASDRLLFVSKDFPQGQIGIVRLIKRDNQYSLQTERKKDLMLSASDLALHPTRSLVAVGGVAASPRPMPNEAAAKGLPELPSVLVIDYSKPSFPIVMKPRIVDSVRRVAFSRDGLRLDCKLQRQPQMQHQGYAVGASGEAVPLSADGFLKEYHQHDDFLMHSGGGHVAAAREGHSIILKEGNRELAGNLTRIEHIGRRPDGKVYATADSEGTVRVWPVADARRPTGVSVRVPRADRICDSHDGALAACDAPRDKTGKLLVWSTSSGEIRHTLPGHDDGIAAIDFAPTANRLASADGKGTIRIWDLDNETVELWKTPNIEISDIKFSTDGQRLAVAGAMRLPAPQAGNSIAEPRPGVLEIWEIEKRKKQFTCEGHADVVRRCIFSPDGNELLSASQDGSLRRWNALTGEQKESIRQLGFTPVEFDCSEEHLAVLWVEQCESESEDRCHRHRGYLEVRAMKDNQRVYRKPLPPGEFWPDGFLPRDGNRARSIDLNDDGDRLLVCVDQLAQILDTETGTHLVNLPESAEQYEYSKAVLARHWRAEERTRTVPMTEVRKEQQELLIEGTIQEGMIRCETDALEGVTEIARVIVNNEDEAIVKAGPFLFQSPAAGTLNLKRKGSSYAPEMIGSWGGEGTEVTLVVLRVREVPVTQEVEQTYTVLIPIFETELQTTIGMRRGFFAGSAKFARNKRGVLSTHRSMARVLDAHLPLRAMELTSPSGKWEKVTLMKGGKLGVGLCADIDSCVSGRASCIDFWNAETGRLIRTLERVGETIIDVCDRPNSHTIIVAVVEGQLDNRQRENISCSILEYNVVSGAVVSTIRESTPQPRAMRCFSDGQGVCWIDWKNTLHVHRFGDQDHSEYTLSKSNFSKVRFSDDASCVLLTDERKNSHSLYDVSSQRRVPLDFLGQTSHVQFSTHQNTLEGSREQGVNRSSNDGQRVFFRDSVANLLDGKHPKLWNSNSPQGMEIARSLASPVDSFYGHVDNEKLERRGNKIMAPVWVSAHRSDGFVAIWDLSRPAVPDGHFRLPMAAAAE